MLLKPRTAADASVIRVALRQVELAKAAEADAEFREYLLGGGLRSLLEGSARSFASLEDFQAWLSSGDRNAEAIRFLVETYNLNAEARSVFRALKADYSDEAFVAFQRSTAKPANPRPIRWAVLQAVLRGHLLKSDSFAAFYAWLGSQDSAAADVRGWIESGGHRQQAAGLVAKWREWYAGDQGRFDLDRRYFGPKIFQY